MAQWEDEQPVYGPVGKPDIIVQGEEQPVNDTKVHQKRRLKKSQYDGKESDPTPVKDSPSLLRFE